MLAAIITRDPSSPRSGVPVVCIAEDRQSCEPALRILIASLDKQCPKHPAVLFCPNATLEFTDWVKKFHSINLNPISLEGSWTKYDIKPVALIAMIDLGYEDILWIDSDILIASDFRIFFADILHDEIVVTEEALSCGDADDGALRARLWGLRVGRVLPRTANTAVVRVTPRHLALLSTWKNYLESVPYRDAQSRPWYERGLHVMGDQEVFTALLTSAEFKHFPVRYLRRGRDIVQFFGLSGYTVRERLLHLLFGLPAFIHSQGNRPWWPRSVHECSFGGKIRQLYQDLSPYIALGRQYSYDLENPDWLNSQSNIVRLFTVMSFGRIPLIGIPIAFAVDVRRFVKSLKK